MTKVVVTLRAGIKEARVPCRLPAVENKIHQGVPVTQSPGREPPSSTAFRHQHRSDPECSISYPVHVSRSLAHRSERAVLREDFSFCCRPLCVASHNSRSSRNFRSTCAPVPGITVHTMTFPSGLVNMVATRFVPINWNLRFDRYLVNLLRDTNSPGLPTTS